MNSEHIINPGDAICLNLQMMTDSMEEQGWRYVVHRPGENPTLKGCLLYYGQSALRKEILYIVPEGSETNFPGDLYCYVTNGTLQGKAPHIRCVDRSLPELMNHVLSVFSFYADFDRDLNSVISNGGNLSELCGVASKYLHNPVYIHDTMFCVIGQSSNVDGMVKFEYNEKTRKPHIPLWLIDEFKFDEAYKRTLSKRQAAVWGNDQYYSNVRSLYVNLWEEKEYLGRVLVNEIESSIKPGQFRVVEYLAGYVILWLRNQALSNQQINYSFEQTFIDILIEGETDERDLKTVLEILGWKYDDKFLCMKLQNQNMGNVVRSDVALNSRLSTILKDYVSFRYQQQLCVIVNQTVSALEFGALRLKLAPLIRDSYMYAGISNPMDGINSLQSGFIQADIALGYITGVDNSEWIVPFSSCALNYIRESACVKLPAEIVAHPVLLYLKEHDKAQGTQYYDTLRQYLQCERNIPATASALIIHRTTLTYRLGKIQELTRLNLDDANLRLYLLLSFQLLEHKVGFSMR